MLDMKPGTSWACGWSSWEIGGMFGFDLNSAIKQSVNQTNYLQVSLPLTFYYKGR